MLGKISKVGKEKNSKPQGQGHSSLLLSITSSIIINEAKSVGAYTDFLGVHILHSLSSSVFLGI